MYNVNEIIQKQDRETLQLLQAQEKQKTNWGPLGGGNTITLIFCGLGSWVWRPWTKVKFNWFDMLPIKPLFLFNTKNSYRDIVAFFLVQWKSELLSAYLECWHFKNNISAPHSIKYSLLITSIVNYPVTLWKMDWG